MIKTLILVIGLIIGLMLASMQDTLVTFYVKPNFPCHEQTGTPKCFDTYKYAMKESEMKEFIKLN